VDRFDEAFTIIRGLLRDGAVDFAGRYHQARDCVLLPRPIRQGGPPIMVGTRGTRMLRLAAAHADAWNAWFSWYGNRPEGLAALRTKVDAACGEVGRDPATLERTVAVSVQMSVGEVPRRGGPPEEAPPIRGSSEEMAAALRAFAAEGISHVQLVVDPITVDSIERLGSVLLEVER
jgi:alkanesulfonate monooxygenase SsuD/methylene tetrahydromethanopterin reductase-like flavin-dependent oxidoreductase (luciferase family)